MNETRARLLRAKCRLNSGRLRRVSIATSTPEYGNVTTMPWSSWPQKTVRIDPRKITNSLAGAGNASRVASVDGATGLPARRRSRSITTTHRTRVPISAGTNGTGTASNSRELSPT
ncbi:hypothetical protein [Micromonospora sonneratiae]|uniref:Uncharacterized protein n=1 Tax=Micromonospora sonneratiae TaxID=1184706 RepID=A0ABW3YLI5_9ACTN